MKIEIWSDFVCPFCYIGKRQLDIALARFPHRDNILVQFRSYQLASNCEVNKSEYSQGFITDKDHIPSEERQAINKRLHKQATEIGLTFTINHMRYVNTFDAHRLVKHASRQGKGTELTERLLKAYFTEAKNISDHLVLLDLAIQVGLNKIEAEKIIGTSKYTNAVREDIDIANEIGIKGVPFFVFNEKYALAGAQSPDLFLEVLETIWSENDEFPRNERVHSRHTSYCSGTDHCEEDDKN